MDQALCASTLDFGSGGIGHFIGFDREKPDTRHACAMDGAFLDRELSDNYIAPKQTVRGWVFLQRPSPYAVPIQVNITLKDTSRKEFTYLVNGEKGDPNADILPRRLAERGLVNVSMCSRK
jgi:hypothetical protein